jgi:LacI family gluconate utilization system Gnt-I transcriptional repressor
MYEATEVDKDAPTDSAVHKFGPMAKKLSSPRTDPAGGAEASTIRLDDVATAAGVSAITVSRCISNPGRVADKTRHHVLRVAEQLGYIPNRLASSLASSRSKVIGAIVPTMLNPIHGVVLQAAFEILAPAGYQLFLGNSHYSKTEEVGLVRSFLGHKVDGVLLTGRDHSEDCKSLLRRLGIPTVEMFEHIVDPIDIGVGSSNFEAGFSLGQYLIARGHRRLAFVGHINFDDSRILGRNEGLIAASAEHDLPPPSVFKVASQPGSGSGGEIVGAILREHTNIDAVVFAGHQIAVGAIHYARDVGIEIPGRLAIAAFGDSPIAQWIRPALTTVRFPLEEMGREAGKALLARFQGKSPVVRTIRLGFEIVGRESA